MLRPIGYPLRTLGEGRAPSLTTDDTKLFQAYAVDQWNGMKVRAGSFLFDQYMFPDFAFEVIDVFPAEGHITPETVVQLEQTPKQILPRTPEIRFSDIVGQERAKDKCRIVQQYLKNPKKFGEWAPRNILFFGPPGTGKTMTAIALANETSVEIYLAKATDLIGFHVGGGAERIHRLFRSAADKAPSIVFIDELDAIGLDRRYQSVRGDVSEVVNALLTEMDGLSANSGVVTIGATNVVSFLDLAIRSRFEEEIMFALPSEEERLQLLDSYSKRMPFPVKADLPYFAHITKGFSGRDIKEKVLKSAFHSALLKGKNKITEDMLRNALDLLLKEKSSDRPKRMFT